MNTVDTMNAPESSFLARYARAGDYTDAFFVDLDREVSLADFIETFYTTPVFKVERALLSVAGKPSSDAAAAELARGDANHFAAWTVESRSESEILLAAGRTRSWLMVQPASPKTAQATRLIFGSAVVRQPDGKLGWSFQALLGFHRTYSRVLLGAAARRLRQ